jgi:hypothetical protein
MQICSRLQATAKDTFIQHGWPHNLRIGPPPAYATLQFLSVIYNLTFFFFGLINGWVHLSYIVIERML